jgi:hypothetical protein
LLLILSSHHSIRRSKHCDRNLFQGFFRILLAEIEDTIRNMPPPATILQNNAENVAWFGRAFAAIENWELSKSLFLPTWHSQILGNDVPEANAALRKLTTLLHQARHALLMQIPGAGSVAVPGGMVFRYFDEIRKIIESAKRDLLFVDPYLDAEFASRYLPLVVGGVSIRLLAREKLTTLLPAVDLFDRQNGRKTELRSAPNFHDRYMLVDGTSCYQSGASFKDGAKSAPTTLTQIIDAFAAVSKTYEDLWAQAQVLR